MSQNAKPLVIRICIRMPDGTCRGNGPSLRGQAMGGREMLVSERGIHWPAMSAPPDELETYLVQRKRRGRLLLATGIAVFVGIVAVPYELMQMGVLRKDTFEIFVAADVFLAIGLVRGFLTHVRGRPWP
jgi:hypothetical protein